MPIHHSHAARTNGRSRAREKIRASECGWDATCKTEGAGFMPGPPCSPSEASHKGDATPRASLDTETKGHYSRELAGRPSESQAEGAGAGAGHELVDDWRFQNFVMGAILLNAVQMGLQVDFQGDPFDQIWEVLANIFTAIFALEMLVKLHLLHCGYFRDRWNWLDFVIAWMGILDTWVLPFILTGDAGLLPFQTLRLIRMVKLLRMRRELMALINGLIGSLKSMLWISILLGLTIYTFGIFCSQVIGSADYSSTGFAKEQYFGNLPRAMLTLFGICVVDSWGAVVFGLWEVQPFLVPLFIIFLVITSFGLLNALIGVIVEQTTLATQAMQKATEHEEREKKMRIVESLMKMVVELDQNNDGSISAAEMEAAEEIPALTEVMQRIDLPPGFTMVDLHTMLDQDGSGEVDKDEFIGGMYRLIFCSEFHAHCLNHLSMAQTKKAIMVTKRELKRDIQQMCAQMKEDFEHVIRKLVSDGGAAAATADAELLDSPRVRTNGSIFNKAAERGGEDPTAAAEVDEAVVRVGEDPTLFKKVDEAAPQDGEDPILAAKAVDEASGDSGASNGVKEVPAQRGAKVPRPKKARVAKLAPPGKPQRPAPVGGEAAAPGLGVPRGGGAPVAAAGGAAGVRGPLGAPVPQRSPRRPQEREQAEQSLPIATPAQGGRSGAPRDPAAAKAPAQAQESAGLGPGSGPANAELAVPEQATSQVPPAAPGSSPRGGAKKRWTSVTVDAMLPDEPSDGRLPSPRDESAAARARLAAPKVTTCISSSGSSSSESEAGEP